MCGGKRYYGGATVQRVTIIYRTVLTDVKPDMACVQEEIFGPVLCVFKYKDTDEAVRLANDTLFGLGAAVWVRTSGSLLPYKQEA